MLAIAILTTIGAVRAGCPASGEDLAEHVDAAATAYLAWEFESFDAHVEQVRTDLGCLEDLVSPPLAAEVHEVFAMLGARQGDIPLSLNAFRGILAADPDYVPDKDFAAKGSVIHQAWQQAGSWQAGSRKGEKVRPLPAGGGAEWVLDGHRRASALPTDRAVLVQYIDPQGAHHSGYHRGGVLPPDLEQMLAPPKSETAGVKGDSGAEPTDSAPTVGTSPSYTAIVPTPSAVPQAHRSRGLLVGGLVGTAAAVVGFGVAESMEKNLHEAETYSEYMSRYNTGMAVTLSSTAASVVGGGLILGAVIKGEW